MEHHDQADRLEREAERMEHEAERVERDIDETRRDWDAKQAEAGVPGAQPEPGEDDEEEHGEQ